MHFIKNCTYVTFTPMNRYVYMLFFVHCKVKTMYQQQYFLKQIKSGQICMSVYHIKSLYLDF